MLSLVGALKTDEFPKSNVTERYDFEHGVNRNLWLTCEATGDKAFCHQMMMIENLAGQPDDSDLRWRQIRDVMNKHYRDHIPLTSLVFSQVVKDVAKYRVAALQLGPGENTDDAAWNLCRSDSYFRK